jgi:hypothetical protein
MPAGSAATQSLWTGARSSELALIPGANWCCWTPLPVPDRKAAITKIGWVGEAGLMADSGPQEYLPISWQTCRLFGGQRTTIFGSAERLRTSKMTHKRPSVGPRVAGVEATTFAPHRVSCRKASTGLRTRRLARVNDCERYCNGSCRTNWAPPTESVVLGSGPRPSAKARSSTRRPCSNPGRP